MSVHFIFAITRYLVISLWYHSYGKTMVPPWYLVYMPGTSGIYFVSLPQPLVFKPAFAGLLFEPVCVGGGEGWGGGVAGEMPKASMPTIYKHLYCGDFCLKSTVSFFPYFRKACVRYKSFVSSALPWNWNFTLSYPKWVVGLQCKAFVVFAGISGLIGVII